MDNVVVNLCPTGMVPTRDMTPHVPLQPDEIVADVLRCADVGITTVHIHARDDNGEPTHDKSVYARIIEGIRNERPDLVLGVSCSGRTVQELALRAEVLELDGDVKPELASLTLTSLNFARQASMNAPDVVQGLAERMRDSGIKAELEVFDIGMANYAIYLEKKGLLSAPHYANLFFGNVATAQSRFSDMAAMVGALPGDTYVSFAGIGNEQKRATAVSIAMGGGVRIGLEDNIWTNDSRSELATNLGLIEWTHATIAQHDRSMMKPDEFRSRFLC